MFYEEGNKDRHVSPDVFVVKDVPRHQRDNYLIWQEGKAPDLVIELTSKSTSDEDRTGKKALYRDTLRVAEYFLFDPKQEYLDPPLQAYRLADGEYAPVGLVGGRVLSEVLGLYLGREGERLRLYDPATGHRLPTPRKRADLAETRAEQAAVRAEHERIRAEQEKTRAERAEAEIERFRREAEELRRRLNGGA
jgi:hypothetical protein